MGMVVALLQVSLDKARTKSEAIVGQEDVPMRSKLKEVEKIYARARAAAGQGGKVTPRSTHAAASSSASAKSRVLCGAASSSSALVSVDTLADPYASEIVQSDKKKKAGTGRRREQKSKARPLDRRMMSDKRQTDMKVRVLTAPFGCGNGAFTPVDRADRPLAVACLPCRPRRQRQRRRRRRGAAVERAAAGARARAAVASGEERGYG
jgi:hypothetical protein